MKGQSRIQSAAARLKFWTDNVDYMGQTVSLEGVEIDADTLQTLLDEYPSETILGTDVSRADGWIMYDDSDHDTFVTLVREEDVTVDGVRSGVWHPDGDHAHKTPRDIRRGLEDATEPDASDIVDDLRSGILLANANDFEPRDDGKVGVSYNGKAHLTVGEMSALNDSDEYEIKHIGSEGVTIGRVDD